MGDNVTAQKPAIDANAIAETALQRAAGAQGQQMQTTQQQQGSGPQPQFRTYDNTGRRYAIREPRIKDRVGYHDANKSAIKVKIELDLEVEVDLYARVKGDVTIGLM